MVGEFLQNRQHPTCRAISLRESPSRKLLFESIFIMDSESGWTICKAIWLEQYQGNECCHQWLSTSASSSILLVISGFSCSRSSSSAFPRAAPAFSTNFSLSTPSCCIGVTGYFSFLFIKLYVGLYPGGPQPEPPMRSSFLRTDTLFPQTV